MSYRNLYLFFDFAEEDRISLRKAYESQLFTFSTGITAQNACERYLKHLIYLYSSEDSKDDALKKGNVLTDCHIKNLLRFLHDEMKVSCPEDVMTEICALDKYAIDEFIFPFPKITVTKQDIEKCINAVEVCRSFVTETEVKLLSEPGSQRQYTWINYDIPLPMPLSRALKNTILEAEGFDAAGDFEYFGVADALDVLGKQMVAAGKWTGKQWDDLCARYDINALKRKEISHDI